MEENMRDVTDKPLATAQNCHEHSVHHWVTEASELGLAVGDWPMKIDTNLGNGQPFFMARIGRTDDGDLAGVRYLQGNGCLRLLVIND
jgi:hypothetical protein